MAIPTVLSQASAGAPALTGQTGTLYDVLKWALPQLGWTVEFDDAANHRIAFRNNPLGTGDFLRIADNPADHDGDERMANPRSYADMSDVNTGLDEVGASNWVILKSLTADGVPRPYWIIGDERSFWLFIGSGDDEHFQWYYFGDIQPDRPGDEGAFLTTAGDELSPSTVSFVGPWSDNDSLAGFSQLRYDLDMALVGVGLNLDSDFAMNSQTGAVGTYPEPATGGIRVADRSMQETRTGGHRRGRLRGWLDIANDVVNVWPNGHVVENQATQRGLIDGMIMNLFPRPSNSSLEGVALLDISSDWNDW